MLYFLFQHEQLNCRLSWKYILFYTIFSQYFLIYFTICVYARPLLCLDYIFHNYNLLNYQIIQVLHISQNISHNYRVWNLQLPKQIYRNPRLYRSRMRSDRTSKLVYQLQIKFQIWVFYYLILFISQKPSVQIGYVIYQNLGNYA